MTGKVNLFPISATLTFALALWGSFVALEQVQAVSTINVFAGAFGAGASFTNAMSLISIVLEIKK